MELRLLVTVRDSSRWAPLSLSSAQALLMMEKWPKTPNPGLPALDWWDARCAEIPAQSADVVILAGKKFGRPWGWLYTDCHWTLEHAQAYRLLLSSMSICGWSHTEGLVLGSHHRRIGGGGEWFVVPPFDLLGLWTNQSWSRASWRPVFFWGGGSPPKKKKNWLLPRKLATPPQNIIRFICR